MLTTTQYRSPLSYSYHKYYIGKQKGGGNSGKFGQIYYGQRFPGNQHGTGFASFLGTIVRGIGNLINHTPGVVKSAAKIAGQSALQGLADYAGDVQAGVPKEVARKRAFKSAVGSMLEQGGRKIKSSGGAPKRRRRRSSKKKRVGRGGKKGKCCKVKRLKQGGSSIRRRRRPSRKGGKKNVAAQKRRRRTTVAAGIKRRSKFDLFSV
jgi:hypothetical protein